MVLIEVNNKVLITTKLTQKKTNSKHKKNMGIFFQFLNI